LRQGEVKSTALSILASARWFTDAVSRIAEKDALLQLRGKWIVELAELEKINKYESGEIKAFMSRATDSYRAPYDRTTRDIPRQCVFVGTVNHEQYFKDETGNRRFCPVRTDKIRLAELERDRDFIWAEAVELYRDGATWYLEDRELVRAAEAQQSER
jgi:putative DNA primase/helicase